MRSGWFWKTDMWQAYLKEYARTRPECLHEWKTSPLDPTGHDFSERKMNFTYEETDCLSQVIDLRTHTWSDVRKSYRSLINQAKRTYAFDECSPEFMARDMGVFKSLHAAANGRQPRNDETYVHQKRWMDAGHGLLVACTDWPYVFAAAYWIIYQGNAYYMSGPSVKDNVQHAVIWKSLQLLKEQGVRFVELGQIDAITEKEKGIAAFKAGFGGEAKPFTVVRLKS